VNEITMTLKVSAAFRDLLTALVEARSAELEELTGQRIALSASATLRWLVEKEALARSLLPPRETLQETPAPRRSRSKTSPSTRTPKPKRSKKP
jgi:hypothetical protein